MLFGGFLIYLTHISFNDITDDQRLGPVLARGHFGCAYWRILALFTSSCDDIPDQEDIPDAKCCGCGYALADRHQNFAVCIFPSWTRSSCDDITDKDCRIHALVHRP